MTNVLVLEDVQERIDKFKSIYPDATIVTTASDCIAQLESGKYTILSLDHDLGGQAYVDSGREDCGMEVVRYLSKLVVRDRLRKSMTIYIHSHNVPASNMMLLALQRSGYNVHRQPFGFWGFWNNDTFTSRL